MHVMHKYIPDYNIDFETVKINKLSSRRKVSQVAHYVTAMISPGESSEWFIL